MKLGLRSAAAPRHTLFLGRWGAICGVIAALALLTGDVDRIFWAGVALASWGLGRAVETA